MRIREGDKWKTAFQMRYGYFEYQVMLFGLFNAAASSQRYVNRILAKILDVFIIVYLDDILIYTKNAGQGYVEAIRWVFGKLRKHGYLPTQKSVVFIKKKFAF